MLGELWQDVVASIGVWARQPLLPVLSLAIFAGPQMALDALAAADPRCAAATRTCDQARAVDLASLPLVLFSIGWVGTERHWYARAFEGERMAFGELWGITWRYFGRFLRLGFIVTIALAPLWVYLFMRAPEALPLWAWAVEIGLMDILLTFVTPALAFTTTRASAAIGIGLRILRREWPRSAAYAFVPPLLFASLSWATISSSFLASLAMSAGSVLLYLLFKGATARFYLRHPEPTSVVTETSSDQ